ncbi:MAG: hypothetical protein ACRDOU_13730 [Streptosporangiaceae bacterium]
MGQDFGELGGVKALEYPQRLSGHCGFDLRGPVVIQDVLKRAYRRPGRQHARDLAREF